MGIQGLRQLPSPYFPDIFVAAALLLCICFLGRNKGEEQRSKDTEWDFPVYRSGWESACSAGDGGSLSGPGGSHMPWSS